MVQLLETRLQQDPPATAEEQQHALLHILSLLDLLMSEPAFLGHQQLMTMKLLVHVHAGVIGTMNRTRTAKMHMLLHFPAVLAFGSCIKNEPDGDNDSDEDATGMVSVPAIK